MDTQNTPIHIRIWSRHFWMLVLALCGVCFALSPAYKSLSLPTRHAYWMFILTVEAFFLLLNCLFHEPANAAVRWIQPTP